MTAGQVTWPFWSPTPEGALEAALDLAEVGPGDHVIDLGCGDGRVLEAAALRGARATGYELDPLRAAASRVRCARFDGAVRVVEADFQSTPLEADAVFAFLSPATMFRMRRQFLGLSPGARVVSYGYGVLGWEPAKRNGRCFLYRMPPTPAAAPVKEGWGFAGLVYAHPPVRNMLTAISFGANAGEVDLEVSSGLPGFAQVYTGASRCERSENIPVDLKINPGNEGSVHLGGVRLQGRELVVAVVAMGEKTRSRELDDEASVGRLKERYLAIGAGRLAPEALFEGD